MCWWVSSSTMQRVPACSGDGDGGLGPWMGRMQWLRRSLLVLAWACAAATIIGFFQPWARLSARESPAAQAIQQAAGTGPFDGLLGEAGRVTVTIRRGAETLTSDVSSLSRIPREVSGAQIPRLVRQTDTQVGIALLELLTSTRQQLELKSQAVYLVPALAVLAAWLMSLSARGRVLPGVVGGLCVAVAGLGGWKVLTSDLQTSFVAVSIGPGLWLSLGAYAGLGLVGLLRTLLGSEEG